MHLKKCLKEHFGPRKENNFWKIHYNNEVHKYFNEPQKPIYIKIIRGEWASHAKFIRMLNLKER